MALCHDDLASDAPTSYIPTQPYDNKRGFEPERIVIPPPAVDFDGGKPAFNVVDIRSFEHGNQDFGNPSFLQAIRSLHKLNLNHIMLSWKYEHRREAQPILPFLLLGPSSIAQNSAFVQTHGITFMLSVRSGFSARLRPKYLDPTSFPSANGLETATIDLDRPYDLITNLRRLIKAMNDHLEKSCVKQPITSIDDIKARILVFCESGNERSTVVVAAYLMVVYGVDAITAIQVVQSQRFCINIEDGMKRMLLDFEDVLVAERQVAAAGPGQDRVVSSSSHISQTPALNRPSKRNIDRAYESDEDMEDVVEWARYDQGNRRTGLAPFTDAGP